VDTVTWRLGPEAALGLANSAHGPGAHYRRRARLDDPPHDHLVDPADAHEFLRTHHIPAPTELPTTGQLARLRELRTLIRALADDPELATPAWRAQVDAALAAVDFRLGPDATLHSAADGWDGIADELLPAALALQDDRARMRRCGNPKCRWLFVDRSRRGDRVWCEAAVCGNRVKVGRHRLRAASAAPDDAPAVSRRGTPSGPRGWS
jgi:predicted RNA-binding Zn ribbon-like protein